MELLLQSEFERFFWLLVEKKRSEGFCEDPFPKSCNAARDNIDFVIKSFPLPLLQ